MEETAERGPVNVWLRPGQPDDAEICGPICYDAFSAIADAHGFPSDYPSAGVATALVPATNTDLFNWCLAGGLRIVELLSLMTIGLYNQPAGSYLPSILF